MDNYLQDTEGLKKEVWALKKISKSQGEAIDGLESSAMRYQSGYVCVRTGTNAGQGYIDYQVTPNSRLRHEFGLVNCKNLVTFDEPYSNIIWATSSDASASDAQSQRSTISKVTTVGMSFLGGASVMTRFEVWGFIDD